MHEVMDEGMHEVMQEVQVMASGEARSQAQSAKMSGLAPGLAPVAALPLELSGRKGSGPHGCTTDAPTCRLPSRIIYTIAHTKPSITRERSGDLRDASKVRGQAGTPSMRLAEADFRQGVGQKLEALRVLGHGASLDQEEERSDQERSDHFIRPQRPAPACHKCNPQSPQEGGTRGGGERK